jgi:hypothetical protein
MKNAVLTIISGLLILTIAIISCKKDSIQQQAPTITSFSPTYDTTGGTVTINGTNFINVHVVSFGGIPAASFQVINPTQITAVVGIGSAGKVAVTTAGGIATYTGFLFPTLYCGCTNSNDIATTNLIAHWPFDSSLNEARSNSQPTLTGGVLTYVQGRIGKAIQLTNGWLTYPAGATLAGIADSIYNNSGVLNSSDTLQNGFTISLWTQIPNHAINDTLLTNLFQLSHYPNTPNWPLAGIAIRRFSDSALQLCAGVTNVDTTGNGIHPSYDSAYVPGFVKDSLSWAFIAIVYSPNQQLQYYFNGVLVYQVGLLTGAVPGAVFSSTDFLLLPAPNYATIGAFESSATFPASTDPLPVFMNPGFTGVLDDIRFFNASLSPQNINDLFVLGNSGR